MEDLTRLVSESMARHGVDCLVDHRRLQWSPWLRCDSIESLLAIPAAPGIFALAEELVTSYVGTAALGCPAERSSADEIGPALFDQSWADQNTVESREGRNSLARHVSAGTALFPERVPQGRHVLAVTEFNQSANMAATLDLKMSRPGQMLRKLWVRCVVIHDAMERRDTLRALNHWLSWRTEQALV